MFTRILEWFVGFVNPKRVALASYVAYTLAGVVLIFYPSEVVANVASAFNIFVWHVFLLVGGLTSLIGLFRKRPLIELAGAPLLLSAFAAYIAILLWAFIYVDSPGAGNRLGFALILLGGAFGIIGRIAENAQVIIVDRQLDIRESEGDSRG